MYTYDEFWSILSSAYPVSHGEIKLPIATKLIEIPHLPIQKILAESKRILESLCVMFSTSENEKYRMLHINGEHNLSGVLSNTFTGVVRLDCVLDQEGKPKILEINADYPDGLLLHDVTYSLLSGTPTTKNLDMYLSLFETNSIIFVLYKKGSFFLDAYYAEYYALQKKGYTCFIGTEEDLVIENGNVFFQGHHIDVIRRCMEVGKFSLGLLEKLDSAKVKFVNTFDLRILGYKNLLSEIDSSFVPKTFSLDETSLAILLQNKNNYIIKPSNLFEGKGIVIGKDCDQKDWESAVNSHADDNYIAQEFVDMQKMTVELYDNGTIVEKELYFDLCPHLFVKDGKIIGDGLVLMRFSENRILNVAQGGGIGYLKI